MILTFFFTSTLTLRSDGKCFPKFFSLMLDAGKFIGQTIFFYNLYYWVNVISGINGFYGYSSKIISNFIQKFCLAL